MLLSDWVIYIYSHVLLKQISNKIHGIVIGAEKKMTNITV